MSEPRKIKLEEWLQYCRNYMKDVTDLQSFAERQNELIKYEHFLIQCGALEESSGDFEQDNAKLIEVYKKLGLVDKDTELSEDTKRRLRNVYYGKGCFIAYEGMTEQQVTEGIKKLAKEQGLKIRKIERIR